MPYRRINYQGTLWVENVCYEDGLEAIGNYESQIAKLTERVAGKDREIESLKAQIVLSREVADQRVNAALYRARLERYEPTPTMWDQF